jgi:trk system potassium uptake protein TrkH
MLIRPDKSEILTIIHFLGWMAILLSVVVFLSAAISHLAGEPTPSLRLGTSGAQVMLAGLLMILLAPKASNLSPSGSFALVGLIWVWATFLMGWVYQASGCFLSFTDGCFDAMSGFTTTGLVLIQDMDHLPEGIQFLRHLLTFIGGQGIIALYLAILAKNSPVFFQLYVGEGKDERLWPNVLHTARTIWKISMAFLVVGTAVMASLLWTLGLSPWRAFFEGLYLFEGAWSTGGFAPHSQSLAYYHSPLLDAVATMIFVVGSFNFFVHFRVFSGKIRELWDNSELRAFALSVVLLTLIAVVSCTQAGVFPTAGMALKRVAFQMVSAHTTTGHMNVYARQFINDWPLLAVLAVTMAMAFGASACSTAGGIKGIRLALMWKALVYDIRKSLLPTTAWTIVRYHHGQSRLLSPNTAYRAFLVGMLFVLMYVLVTAAGVAAGYPLLDSLFEGVSAASNSGLSCGLTTASMPWGLKWTYIVAMWLGRLEFLAAFVLLGYIGRWVFGR